MKKPSDIAREIVEELYAFFITPLPRASDEHEALLETITTIIEQGVEPDEVTRPDYVPSTTDVDDRDFGHPGGATWRAWKDETGR
jgi:hypothetical protein